MNKYILAEDIKHILNEKYLLDERFILNEAASQQVLDNYMQTRTALDMRFKAQEASKIDWNGLLTNVKNTLSSLSSKAAQPTAVHLENAVKNIEGAFAANDLDRVKNNIKTYLNNFLTAIDKDQNAALNKIQQQQYSALGNAYNQLRNVVTDQEKADVNNPNANNSSELVELKNKFNNFKQAVDTAKIFASDNATKWSDRFTKSYEAVQQWLNTFNELKAKSDAAVTSQVATDQQVEAVTQAIDAIMGNQNFIAPTEWIKGTTINDISSAIQTFDKVSSISLDDWKTSVQAIADEQQFNKTNWAAEFNKAAKTGNTNKLQKLWDKYYKEVWGKHAQKVRALGSTLTNLLLDESNGDGFEPYHNPWLIYIKYCFDNGYNLNYDNFKAIYEAHSYLSPEKANLQRKDILSAHGGNILYCKDLYRKDAAAIKNYLAVQQKIKSYYDEGFTELKAGHEFANGTLTANYVGDINKALCFIDSLFDANMNALTQRATSPKNVTDIQLKDIRNVYQEFYSSFNEEPEKAKKEDEKKEPTNVTFANLVKGLDTAGMQKLLYYFATTYQKDTSTDLFALINPYMTGIPTLAPREIATFAKKFKSLLITNPAKTTQDILQAAKAAGIQGFENVR